MSLDTKTTIAPVEDNNGPPRKKRRLISLDTGNTKCPVMKLNELKPDLVYTFSDTGPPHDKIFQTSVVFSNQTFTAEGRTKKEAKKTIAKLILRSLIQLKDPSIANQFSSPDTRQIQDFSLDPSEVVESSPTFYCFQNTHESTGHVQSKDKSPKAAAQSSPLYCLKRFRQDIKVEITKAEGSPHNMMFTAQVELDGEVFEGTGTNKKQAKNAAAKEALKHAKISLPKSVTETKVGKTSNNEFGDIVSRFAVKSIENY